MNFRDYDRKFWLIIEKENKKIIDLIRGCDGNSILCYSYYENTEGLVYEAISSALYINGDYSITKQSKISWEFKTYVFTKKQLNDFQIIPINNRVLSVLFNYEVEKIKQEHYDSCKDLIQTRDIRFIDEFRQENNPDVLKSLLTDMKTCENIWIKIEKLEKFVNENTYVFSCEILSEPFTINGIHKGDKTLAFALNQNDTKICVCTIGVSEIEDIRKTLKLI